MAPLVIQCVNWEEQGRTQSVHPESMQLCLSTQWKMTGRLKAKTTTKSEWMELLRQRRRQAAPIDLPPPTLSQRLNERPRKAPPLPPTGQSKGGWELLWLWGHSVETRSQRRRGLRRGDSVEPPGHQHETEPSCTPPPFLHARPSPAQSGDMNLGAQDGSQSGAEVPGPPVVRHLLRLS
ncbi:unnamed protein product [Pleuronectes platessa]|uniref:Uncharacterized protein n=1 Tax=Pleuronectes platessa TaxID=8262 RepID=A0A9N7Y9B7_PLEPL|nr:unnamed protein product [Pleuronectes platessa]